MFVLFVSILLLSIHQGQCAVEAMANLQRPGTTTSVGTLRFFQQDSNSPIQITGTLTSLDANSTHGFHVHTLPVAETSPNCTAAAGHFNPYNVSHGPRIADIWHRHVGDLGNLTTDMNGAVMVSIQDIIIQFYNDTQQIAGRTIIIHQMFDDGGTGVGESTITGNAGARIACGFIKVTSNTTMSDGLNIKPTISALLLTIIITFMMLFY